MKKKSTNLYIGIILTVLIFVNGATAQIRPAIDVQEWSKGKVVLTSGDTIYGSIVLHRSQDVINVKLDDGTICSYSPVNVEYFVAQEINERPYLFRTFLWDQGRDYSDFKKPTFFEQLIEGPLTLVMRESYMRKDAFRSGGRYFRPSSNNTQETDWTEMINEAFFAVLPDGEVVTLRRLRKDLHALFGDKSEDVKSFVKKNSLDYTQPHHLIAIINYYNTLVSPSYVTSFQSNIGDY